jgi:hypothetical protein
LFASEKARWVDEEQPNEGERKCARFHYGARSAG